MVEPMLLIILLIILFFLVIVSFLYFTREKRKFTGNSLEWYIHKTLKQIAKKEGGIELHDLLFEQNGHTTQIDNLLLTRKALYVIEAKDFSGYIFGSQNNTYWTQVFTHYKAKTSGNNYTKSGVSRYKFYNPIKQNQTHINIINRLTNIESIMPIFNIVVFGSKATLREINHSDSVNVVYDYELEEQIYFIESEICVELEPMRQAHILDTLLYLNIEGNEARNQHIINTNKKYKRIG